MLKHIMSKDEVPTPKGAEILPDKVLTSKTWFFSPKSVMRSQKFTTPPKGTTPNAEAHCVQR